MGISKRLKRKYRRRHKNGGVRHRVIGGRTGSLRHKQRRGLLIDGRKPKP